MPNDKPHPKPGLSRYLLPAWFLAFACTGDPGSDRNSDSNGTEEHGDGDGDGQPGDGDSGDGDSGDDEPGDSGDDEPGDGDGDPGEVEELRSDAPHDEDPQLDPAEAQALAAANHALTLDLYHALRNGQAADKGFSVSAYSIASAFGLLHAGSLEPARSQIAQTLHYPFADEQQHLAHNWLDAQLAKRNIPGHEYADPVVVQTANSVWLLDDYADGVSPDYLDLLSIHYDLGVKLMDFADQPEVAREAINDWVSERTGELIPELFPPNSIHNLTRIVLVNALYVAAPWLEPFVAGFTQERDFTLRSGEVISVEMMRTELSFSRYAATAEYEAATMRLRGHDLDVVVIAPYNFDAFEDTLDQAKLAQIFASLAPEKLALHLPKFDLAADFKLTQELKGMGMDAPFTDLTSFHGIHPELRVIDVVVHNTVIKVDEEGIEAAAATGIGGDGDGDGDVDPPTLMIVDRPFLLAIRDQPTNTLLFFGRVLDPTQ